MRKILNLILIIFLVIGMSVVYAQEETEDDGGVAPDSAFYGLDRAFERLDLLITLRKAEKAKKGLAHARERLLEARKLIKENKLEHLERLKEDHKESVEKVKAELQGLESDNPEESLDEEVEIETEVEAQENELDEISTDLDLKVSDKLTDEQAAKLKDFLNSLGNDVLGVKLKIKNGKEAIKIRYKEGSNKTDKEVADKEKEIEKKHKLTEVKEKVVGKELERLEKKLKKLKEITQKHKANGRDVSEMETRLEKVSEILSELKVKLADKDFEKVRELIKEANKLLNFSEAFRAIESKDEGRLSRVAASNREDLDRLRLKVKEAKEELKDKRMEIKEGLKERGTEREAKKEDSKETESEDLKVKPY
ncbi:hypothetical protein HYX16_03170 [Candidatus Woesearchaeota archaeon]|nr:hypothetical protein [Candidatus Woesearchaeota archaeon]